MKFINEFHKQAMLHNMKQIEEWKKHPAPLEEVLARQRRREQLAEEMEKQEILKNSNDDKIEK